jgi:hypothetical protein
MLKVIARFVLAFFVFSLFTVYGTLGEPIEISHDLNPGGTIETVASHSINEVESYFLSN